MWRRGEEDHFTCEPPHSPAPLPKGQGGGTQPNNRLRPLYLSEGCICNKDEK